MISCCRLQSGVPLASSLHALGYRTSSRPTLKDALPLNGCRWRRRRTLPSTKGLYRWSRSRAPAAHSPQIQRRGISLRRSRKSTRGAAKYCTDSASPRLPAAKVAALVEGPYETTCRRFTSSKVGETFARSESRLGMEVTLSVG